MDMERNTIKVLWIEDDLGVYESFRNPASTYGIQFIHADNWQDGKLLLKEPFNELSAIILDAQCKWEKDAPAEDRFLNDVLSELWEVFGEVRRTIPWYILSAGTMNNYAGIIETANSRKRQSFDKDWGPVSWKKVEVVSKTLKVRKGAGSTHKQIGTVKKGEVYTIIKKTADGKWGLLKAGPIVGSSYINLSTKYVKKK